MHNFIVKHSRFKFRFLHKGVWNFAVIFYFIFNLFRKVQFDNLYLHAALKLNVKMFKALFDRVFSARDLYIHSFNSDEELEIKSLHSSSPRAVFNFSFLVGELFRSKSW